MKKYIYIGFFLFLGCFLFSYLVRGNLDQKWYKYKDEMGNSSSKFTNEISVYEFTSNDDAEDKYLVIYDNSKTGAYCKETKFRKYICTPMVVKPEKILKENKLDDIIYSYDIKKSFLAKIDVWNFLFMKKLDMKFSELDDACLLNNKCDYKKKISYFAFEWQTAKNLFVAQHSGL